MSRQTNVEGSYQRYIDRLQAELDGCGDEARRAELERNIEIEKRLVARLGE